MAVTRLTTVPYNTPGANPVDPAGYVSAVVLAANTAKSITVPAGAVYVRLAATADVFYSFTTTASVPVDKDDGTSFELLKQQGDAEWRKIPSGASTLSVVSASTPIVTASFFGV